MFPLVYSSVRFIKDQIHSVSGSGVAVHMIMPGTAYESSSGGPFFRDINNQGTAQQEFYWYMNSGHTQTEDYRQGLHGPYALWFTTGSTPSTSYDLSFWATVNPSGYVAASGRGYVSGKAIDVPSAYASQVTIGWSNSVAQYWATADSSTQNFYSPAMKPGTYTMTLYKGELAVGSQSVAVTAGTTVTSNIHDTWALDVSLIILMLSQYVLILLSYLDSNVHLEDWRFCRNTFWIFEC
jgi:rhamnogalacturonan endolyase